MDNSNLNSDFGVSDDVFEQEAAFPSSDAMPQFSAPYELQDDILVPMRPNPPNIWPPKLVMDMALGIESQEDVLARYGLTEAELDKLFSIPAFRLEVAALCKTLRESGVTFAKKAAIQAETYLTDINAVMLSPDTPASTKVDIFKTMAKFGNLEPAKDKTDDNKAPQVNIQINI